MTKRNKLKNIFTFIFLYLLIPYGLIYIFFPHSWHIKGWALDWVVLKMFNSNGLIHIAHVIIGLVMLGVAAVILYLKFKKKEHY